MPHIVDIIEKFYINKDKILSLIDKYIHDNAELAKLVVESRTNYLYTLLKKDRPFPKKYIEWRKGMDEEVNNILKRRQ